MREFIKLVLIGLIVWVGFESHAGEIELQEYDVLSDVISQKYIRAGVSVIVMLSATQCCMPPLEKPNPNWSLQPYSELKRQSPDLLSETLDDFKVKNASKKTLKNRFSLSSERVLLSRDQLKNLIPDACCGWKSFYKRYPTAPGIITVSRVGFNHQKNQALVYVGNQKQSREGLGVLYILVKTENSWIIQQELEMWES